MLNNTLKDNVGEVVAIIDDNHLPGKMDHIFCATETFADNLVKVGLALQPKTS